MLWKNHRKAHKEGFLRLQHQQVSLTPCSWRKGVVSINPNDEALQRNLYVDSVKDALYTKNNRLLLHIRKTILCLRDATYWFDVLTRAENEIKTGERT